MKRLASAVLFAFMSLVGSINIDADASGGIVGAEPSDDAREPAAASIEYTSGDDDSAGPRFGHDARVLALASRWCGESIDRAWILRSLDGASAAAVAVQARGDEISVVSVAVRGDAATRMDPSPAQAAAQSPARSRVESLFAAPLLWRALDHCRDRGDLKIIVVAEGLAQADVRSLTESRGFQFSRIRPQADGTDAIEFYVDLYWRQRSA